MKIENVDYDVIDNNDPRVFKIHWKVGDILPDGTKLELTNAHGWIINRKGRGAHILDQLSNEPIWVSHNKLSKYLNDNYNITKVDYYCIINHGLIKYRKKCRVESCYNECQQSIHDPKYTYTTVCKDHINCVHSITMTEKNIKDWSNTEYRKHHSEEKQIKVNRSVFINKFGPDSTARIYLTTLTGKKDNTKYYKYGITHCLDIGRERGLSTYFKEIDKLETMFIGTSEQVAWIESIVKYLLCDRLIDVNYIKGSECIPIKCCSKEFILDIIQESITEFNTHNLEYIRNKYK